MEIMAVACSKGWEHGESSTRVGGKLWSNPGWVKNEHRGFGFSIKLVALLGSMGQVGAGAEGFGAEGLVVLVLVQGQRGPCRSGARQHCEGKQRLVLIQKQPLFVGELLPALELMKDPTHTRCVSPGSVAVPTQPAL